MKKIKITAYFLGFALLAYCFGVFIVEKISAAELTGWLWGGSEEVSDGNMTNGNSGWETGVGWISMSRKNCDPSGDGMTESLSFSNCPVNQPITQDANYGVIIPDTNGKVTGFAWSENLGWIDFNPQDHCVIVPPMAGTSQYQASNCTPPSGNAGVFRNNDELIGWARIVSIATAGSNAGGWQGWIKLSGSIQGGGTYGVNLNNMDGDKTTHTYAWSGGVTAPELGWIDFGQALFVQKKVIVCPDKYSLKVNDSYNFKSYFVDEDVTCSTLGAALQITDDAETTWDTTTSTKISVDNNLDKGKATALSGTGDNNYTADVNATYNGLTGTAVVCVSDGSCINETCQGATCSECGYDPIEGIKDCGGTDWQEVVD